MLDELVDVELDRRRRRDLQPLSDLADGGDVAGLALDVVERPENLDVPLGQNGKASSAEAGGRW
jgi:hypothetical protein